MQERFRAALGAVAAVTLPLVGAYVVALVTLAVVLSACAPGGSTAAEEPLVTSDGRFYMGEPGEAIAQDANLTYYPACDNEPLTYEGTTWYPFTPTNAAVFPSSDPDLGGADAEGAGTSGVWEAVSGRVGMADAVLTADAAVTVVPASAGAASAAQTRGVPAVAAPEPGQDKGVLTVYEGGLAHWASAFGDLDTWLTDTEIQYRWAC